MTSQLIERYQAWQANRATLSEQEEQGNYPAPGRWHDSDDDAVSLLDEAMTVIVEVQSAFNTISEALGDIQAVYEVGFTCSEAEALYEAMVAVGATDTAEHFMTWHSTLDDPDEGDLHSPVYSTEHPDLPIGFTRLDA